MGYKRNAPTERMKKVFREVQENGTPVAVAMRENGYSHVSAKNPQKLTQSKQWQHMLDKYGLSGETLAKRHGELVQSKKEDVALRAIDMGYKVTGKYEQHKGGNTFNAPVQIVINPPKPETESPHAA